MIITEAFIETVTQRLITSAAVYCLQEAGRILTAMLSGL